MTVLIVVLTVLLLAAGWPASLRYENTQKGTGPGPVPARPGLGAAPYAPDPIPSTPTVTVACSGGVGRESADREAAAAAGSGLDRSRRPTALPVPPRGVPVLHSTHEVHIPAYPAWLYEPVDLTAGTSLNVGEWCAIGEQPSRRRRHYPPTDLGLVWEQPPTLPVTLPHDWPGLTLDAVPTGEPTS